MLKTGDIAENTSFTSDNRTYKNWPNFPINFSKKLLIPRFLSNLLCPNCFKPLHFYIKKQTVPIQNKAFHGIILPASQVAYSHNHQHHIKPEIPCTKYTQKDQNRIPLVPNTRPDPLSVPLELCFYHFRRAGELVRIPNGNYHLWGVTIWKPVLKTSCSWKKAIKWSSDMRE